MTPDVPEAVGQLGGVDVMMLNLGWLDTTCALGLISMGTAEVVGLTA
jgi:hypothetical protein